MIEQELSEHYRSVPDDPAAEARIRAAALTPPPRRHLAMTTVAAAVLAALLVVAGELWIERPHAAHRPQAHRSAAAGDPLLPLYGVTWLDNAADVTLVFVAGTLHQSDGCSGTANAVSDREGHLHIGAIVASGYTCSGAVGPAPGTSAFRKDASRQRAEQRLDHVLAADPTWSVAGATLTLSSGSVVVRLTSSGTARTTLPGSRWRLATYASKFGSGGSTKADLTLAFDNNSRFIAYDGCGSITGPAVVTGSTVDFTGARSGFCGWGPGSAAAVISSLLSRKADFQIVHNSLRLTDPSTQALLVYVPAH